MAKNSRDEAIIETNSQLVPTIDASELRAYLNDEVLNSVVFEKDVIASETPAAGAVTIDYEDKDLATVTTAVDLAVSFTNLENGAVKYLALTKGAANVISFAGATDVSYAKNYIKTVATYVIYRVSNKNGAIFVESINIDNSISQSTKIIDIGDWNMDTTIAADVAHGLDFTKIRAISVMIRSDSGTQQYMLDSVVYNPSGLVAQGGIVSVDSTNIRLARADSGIFDNGGYDSTSYNRGWIHVIYEV